MPPYPRSCLLPCHAWLPADSHSVFVICSLSSLCSSLRCPISLAPPLTACDRSPVIDPLACYGHQRSPPPSPMQRLLFSTPRVFFFFQIIDEETQMLYSKTFLKVNATAPATYECIAQNRLTLKGTRTQSKSAYISIIGQYILLCHARMNFRLCVILAYTRYVDFEGYIKTIKAMFDDFLLAILSFSWRRSLDAAACCELVI